MGKLPSCLQFRRKLIATATATTVIFMLLWVCRRHEEVTQTPPWIRIPRGWSVLHYQSCHSLGENGLEYEDELLLSSPKNVSDTMSTLKPVLLRAIHFGYFYGYPPSEGQPQDARSILSGYDLPLVTADYASLGGVANLATLGRPQIQMEGDVPVLIKVQVCRVTTGSIVRIHEFDYDTRVVPSAMTHT